MQQHRGGERKSYWVSDQRPFDPGKEFWSFLHYADLEACYMELLNEILPLFCFFLSSEVLECFLHITVVHLRQYRSPLRLHLPNSLSQILIACLKCQKAKGIISD